MRRADWVGGVDLVLAFRVTEEVGQNAERVKRVFVFGEPVSCPAWTERCGTAQCTSTRTKQGVQAITTTLQLLTTVRFLVPNPASEFYMTLLDASERMFDGEIDWQQFEEVARFMFGTKAHVVFTIDLLAGRIIKQASA